MVRKIKIITTVGISGVIETNVSNLGELKPLLSQRDINYDGMKLLIGETKNELSEDMALLPEGDFKLYMVPARTKSGGIDDSLDDIFSDLQSIDTTLENIDGTLDEMGKRLRNIENDISTILSMFEKNYSNTTRNKATESDKSESLSLEDLEDLEDFNKVYKTNWD